MKSLIAIGLLLISAPAILRAQRKPVIRTQDHFSETALTRKQIKEAERQLSDLGYWTGAVDGILDPATRAALVAFQKWEGRPVNGVLTLAELAAIRNSSSPGTRETGYAHAEVDVDRQVMLLVNDEGAVRVLPVSTGSDKPYEDDGQTSIAHTPRGRFVVYDKFAGWEKPPNETMYYSNYISGGVAIHGYRDVPVQPASHGCIRVPMFAARKLSEMLPIGTIVLVYDRISFVSGKLWVDSPKLKQAVLDWNRLVDN